jgi:hypothetical protein
MHISLTPRTAYEALVTIMINVFNNLEGLKG